MRLMCFRFLLLACVSGLWSVPAVARLAEDVQPLRQQIHLILDADQKDYSGWTAIDLEVQRAVQSFSLHAERMELKSVKLLRGESEIPVQPERGEHGLLTLSVEKDLPVDEPLRLEIEFHNQFGTQAVGLYRTEVDGKGYSFTQFQVDDAREAFPCFDEPVFKIPFQVTLSVPRDHLAVTNALVEAESYQDGWKTVVFQEMPPTPSYLLAIATGRLDAVVLQDFPIPARIITVQGKTGLTEVAQEQLLPLLQALETWFDNPYPYSKLDLIAVPEFWPGAMENPGAITFADRILLVSPQEATGVRRARLAHVLAHELAHMWFGDLVTLEWWDDLWLNETFADWLAYRIAHQVYPEYDFDQRALGTVHRMMRIDALASTPAVRRPVTGTENLLQTVGLAYNKGKAILRMFEAWLGAEAFRQGVLLYIEQNSWSNATSAELWSALEEVTSRPVGRAMGTFLEQNGFPLLEVQLREDNRVLLRQSHFVHVGEKPEERLWQVPVRMLVSDGEKTVLIDGLLSEYEMILDVPSDLGAIQWILPNADARGYYRWQLPSALLESLLAHTDQLSVEERLSLLSNLGALLGSGGLTGGNLFSALESLLSDPSEVVVHAALELLRELQEPLVPEAREQAFHTWLSPLLEAHLKDLGFTPEPEENFARGELRKSVLIWLGQDLEHPEVLKWAKSSSDGFLEDSSSVEQGLAEVALYTMAAKGDADFLNVLQKRFESAELPRSRSFYLGLLGGFRKADLAARLLDYSLGNQFRANEILVIAEGLFFEPRLRDQVFQWVQDNDKALLKRLPPITAVQLANYMTGCSSERLQKGQEFFSGLLEEIGGLEVSLARASDSVRECLALRQREADSVSDFLESRLEPAEPVSGESGPPAP